MINQLSVFVENKFGRMAAVTKVLEENSIDINALSLADTSDFGILRIIVDQPDLAKICLHEAGIMVKTTKVISAGMDNKPGGLAKILDVLTEGQISVEYMYAFLDKVDGKAWTVMRTDDNERAENLLRSIGVEVH